MCSSRGGYFAVNGEEEGSVVKVEAKITQTRQRYLAPGPQPSSERTTFDFVITTEIEHETSRRPEQSGYLGTYTAGDCK